MPGAAQARPRSHRQQRPAGLGVHICPRVAQPSPPRHRTCPRRGPPGPRARRRAAGGHIMHPAAAHCQGRKIPDTDPALIPPVRGAWPRPGPSSASTVTASPRYQSAVVRQTPWSRPVHPERVWSRNHLAQAARSRTGSHPRPSATRQRDHRRATAADTGDALRRSAPRNRNMLPSGPAELAPRWSCPAQASRGQAMALKQPGGSAARSAPPGHGRGRRGVRNQHSQCRPGPERWPRTAPPAPPP